MKQVFTLETTNQRRRNHLPQLNQIHHVPIFLTAHVHVHTANVTIQTLNRIMHHCVGKHAHYILKYQVYAFNEDTNKFDFRAITTFRE
jgi:hypothetical protein